MDQKVNEVFSTQPMLSFRSARKLSNYFGSSETLSVGKKVGFI